MEHVACEVIAHHSCGMVLLRQAPSLSGDTILSFPVWLLSPVLILLLLPSFPLKPECPEEGIWVKSFKDKHGGCITKADKPRPQGQTDQYLDLASVLFCPPQVLVSDPAIFF